jgi:threonine/homoserine/homoserine lactone efflux protein
LGSALTELVPLSLVVALSPLSIIPAVLVLHSPRPKPAGLAFLAGWVAALTALTSLFLAVSSLLGGMHDQRPTWASWLRVIVGAALIVFGIFRWVTRHSKPHQMPGARHLTEAGPGKALALGALLTVVNPKVLFVCAAAGLAIGTSGLADASTGAVFVFVFVVLSASTVALPILAYAASGERLDPTLTRVKVWMEKHNAALVAGILVVIGVMVLYKGVHGL